LTVPNVFSRLGEIARTSGAQSQAKKTKIITGLLAACQTTIGSSTSSEAKFIIRSLEGKLRIGLAERTVLVSLAQAIVLDEQKRRKLLPFYLCACWLMREQLGKAGPKKSCLQNWRMLLQF
jgi:ATP-dependent DNA ligase